MYQTPGGCSLGVKKLNRVKQNKTRVFRVHIFSDHYISYRLTLTLLQVLFIMSH